jgi:mannose-6-phosphate isomerase-like protein (cupin superfamily)
MKKSPGIVEKDFKRPWGGFIKFIDNKPCTVKILYIKKKEILSLQFHKFREEFWYVISGKIRVTVGKNLNKLKKTTLKEGQFISIPKKFLHRIEGLTLAKVLEISIGKFKERDEIRIEDKYGRNNPK